MSFPRSTRFDGGLLLESGDMNMIEVCQEMAVGMNCFKDPKL